MHSKACYLVFTKSLIVEIDRFRALKEINLILFGGVRHHNTKLNPSVCGILSVSYYFNLCVKKWRILNPQSPQISSRLTLPTERFRTRGLILVCKLIQEFHLSSLGLSFDCGDGILFGSMPSFGKIFGHVCGMVDVPFNWSTFLANQMLILDRSQSSVHEELWMKSFWRTSGLDSGFLGYHCPPRWTCWSGSCKKEL